LRQELWTGEIARTASPGRAEQQRGAGLRAIIEVLVAYALLEGALWSQGMAQAAWSFATLGWVTYCTLRSGRSGAALGLSVLRSWRGAQIVPASVLVALCLLGAGSAVGTLHEHQGLRTPFWHAVFYGVWAFVQQFLAQSFIFVRLETVLGGRRAVLWSAVLFAFAHVPNPVLMAATLIMGLVLTEWFRRYRNLYPLAIVHAILGLTLAVVLPESVTHHMRVGIAWWR